MSTARGKKRRSMRSQCVPVAQYPPVACRHRAPEVKFVYGEARRGAGFYESRAGVFVNELGLMELLLFWECFFVCEGAF